MAKYTMLWIGETKKWHMFKGDILDFDTEQFENGYVAYEIKTHMNDIIIKDTWNHANVGKKFSEVYNMLEVNDGFYLKSYIESRNREQLLKLMDDHGYEGIRGFSDSELKDILLRL